MKQRMRQRVTRFWYGEKFIFERVGRGEWKCIHQDSKIIPHSVIEDLGD